MIFPQRNESVFPFLPASFTPLLCFLPTVSALSALKIPAFSDYFGVDIRSGPVTIFLPVAFAMPRSIPVKTRR